MAAVSVSLSLSQNLYSLKCKVGLNLKVAAAFVWGVKETPLQGKNCTKTTNSLPPKKQKKNEWNSNY